MSRKEKFHIVFKFFKCFDPKTDFHESSSEHRKHLFKKIYMSMALPTKNTSSLKPLIEEKEKFTICLSLPFLSERKGTGKVPLSGLDEISYKNSNVFHEDDLSPFLF